MQVPRSGLVLVAAVVTVLLIAAAQVPMPTTHVEPDHGWAGPYPHQLVSYNVKVTTGSGKWGSAVTVVPTVPGNGMVITGISAVREFDANGGGTYQVRVMQNTTTQVGQLEFKEGFFKLNTSGMTSSPPVQTLDLGHGIPIPKGVPLSIEATSSYGALPLSVTITGYTW